MIFGHKRCQPLGYHHSKMGRADEGSSFLLLNKLYYPIGMKNRGTTCVAVEREASCCQYSATRAKSFVIDGRSLSEFQSSDCLQHTTMALVYGPIL